MPWPEALGMVFVNGLIFLSLSVTGVRERIVDAIPVSLKVAITCGIGLFIAFIGLKNGGVIVADAATYVAHGEFLLAAGRPLPGRNRITAILVVRQVPGRHRPRHRRRHHSRAVCAQRGGGQVTLPPTAFFSWPQQPRPALRSPQFRFPRELALVPPAIPIILTFCSSICSTISGR